MGLRDIVLDESQNWCVRHDAYNRLAQTGGSSSETLVNELLSGNNSSRLLGALFAARDGHKSALPILHRMLKEAIPQEETTWLNMHAKVLQAVVRLDPENSQMLLSRMLSTSPTARTWNTVVVAAASIAPREQALSFCRSLLEDRRLEAWHIDAQFILARFEDKDAISTLEELINGDCRDPLFVKAVVVLSQAKHAKARRILIELLRQFESLPKHQQNTLHLHIFNLYELYMPPAEAVRELKEMLERDKL